jgi:hypothetical protein
VLKITVNNKRYKGVYSWSDITLQQFCNLAAIPMPEGYEAYILADGKFSVENIDQYIEAVSKITEKQIIEDFPAYYRQVIQCLSNVPVHKLTLDQVNDLYEYYFKPFVLSLLYHAPVIHFMGEIKQYEPEPVKSIKIGLQTFRVPETVRIMDQDIPLANEPIISYTDASDIYKGMKVSKEDVNRLALFMAIYCRKKGEVYNDRKALERQSLFMTVPMSKVWSVFFYTVRRLPDSSMITLLFGRLPKQIREVRERVRVYRDLVHTD